MVQLHARCKILLQTGRIADFIATKRLADLLRECFLVAELCEERFVEQIGDVFGVVVGCAGS